jgi:hypothetical protein
MKQYRYTIRILAGIAASLVAVFALGANGYNLAAQGVGLLLLGPLTIALAMVGLAEMLWGAE